MNSRARVLTTLQHQEPDRVPIDLGGMRSTGVTAIAYNRLLDYLGIEGMAKVADTGQQLANVEEPVRQRFHVDVAALDMVGADWVRQDCAWQTWQLADGSSCMIPVTFNPVLDENGDWVIRDAHGRTTARMPKGGYYFDGLYHPLAEVDTIEGVDAMAEYWQPISNEVLDYLHNQAQDLYENTEYAILGGFGGSFLEAGQGLRGWDTFMMDLALRPDFVEHLLDLLLEGYLINVKRYVEAVGDYVQLINVGGDLGTQNGPQLSPAMYQHFIQPRQAKFWAYIHDISDMYVFLHSCGGIYPLIPGLIAAGVDVLNPVQTSAAGMDPVRLKREFGEQIVFWGGGCDTQTVLGKASPQEVREHVHERIRIFAPGGGFVFNQVHNIQVEVPPENIVAMLDAAYECGTYPIS
jgi:uroporphyrinogen decarboxylase